MMKKMSQSNKNPIPSGAIPDELLNQLKPKWKETNVKNKTINGRG
jgi:hypothetical protein